jgi:1-aminocyclopropane-1-carboxylate deaminase
LEKRRKSQDPHELNTFKKAITMIRSIPTTTAACWLLSTTTSAILLRSAVGFLAAFASTPRSMNCCFGIRRRRMTSTTTTIGSCHTISFRLASPHSSVPSEISPTKQQSLSFGNSSSTSSNSYLDSNNNAWQMIDWNTFANSPTNRRSEHLRTTSSSTICNTSSSSVSSSSALVPVYYPHPSPIQTIQVRNRTIYVKRDDLLRLSHSNINGNKARKLLSLAIPSSLGPSDFPNVIVSYGGPQSNAMVALAAIVQQKDREAAAAAASSSDKHQPQHRFKRFLYYTKKLPRYLRDQPCGNLLRAISLGMELQEVSPDEYKQLFGTEVDGRLVQYPPRGLKLPPSIEASEEVLLWIPQGAACGVAYEGVYQLANEIISFWKQQQEHQQQLPLTIIIPSGTGTVALFLHRALKQQLQQQQQQEGPTELDDIQVCAIPCVGDTSYLLRQMIGLDIATGGSGLESDLPYVWEVDYPQRFGEPTKEILQTFQEMKHYGLFLDLLYGAPSWNLLLRKENFQNIFPNRQLMYVHCGGLEGISTQLTRYKHKGLIDARDIQV